MTGWGGNVFNADNGGRPAVRGLRTWPVIRSDSLIGDWRKILEGLNVARCSYNREDLTDAAPYKSKRRESCPAVGRGCWAPPWSFIFPERRRRRRLTTSSLQTADDLFARQRNSWSKLSAVDKDDKYHHLKWQTRQWHPSEAVKETRPAFRSIDKWMRQRGERGTNKSARHTQHFGERKKKKARGVKQRGARRGNVAVSYRRFNAAFSFVTDEEWKAAVVTKYRDGAEDAPVCWLEAGWASSCLPLNYPVSTSPSRQTPPRSPRFRCLLFLSLFSNDGRDLKKEKKKTLVLPCWVCFVAHLFLSFFFFYIFSHWWNMLFHPPLLYILITPPLYFFSFLILFLEGTIPEKFPVKKLFLTLRLGF